MQNLIISYLDLVNRALFKFKLCFEGFWWHENNNYLENKTGKEAEIMLIEYLVQLQVSYDEIIKIENELNANFKILKANKPIQPYFNYKVDFDKCVKSFDELESIWQSAESHFKFINELPLNYFKIRQMFKELNSKLDWMRHEIFDTNEVFINFTTEREPKIIETINSSGHPVTEIIGGVDRRVFQDQSNDNEIKNEPEFFDTIFLTKKNHELFNYLSEHYDNDKTPVKYSHIYHFMIDLMGKNSIGRKEYIKYLKEKHKIIISKVQDDNSLYHDRAKQKLTALKSRFTGKTN